MNGENVLGDWVSILKEANGKVELVKAESKPLAINICVGTRRINEIVLGKRGISADTALRLARFFGNSPSSGWACKPRLTWMSLKIRSERDWIGKCGRIQQQIERSPI